MARVEFTPNLARHLDCAALDAPGNTVRAVLDHVCRRNPKLRGYVLDDQNRLRRHVTIFVDGEQVKDRNDLQDPVQSGSTVFILQALSGG